MLYPKEGNWASWRIEKPLHKQFVLHWSEIFDSATSDSWQVRTANFQSILREMTHIAKLSLDYPPYRTNLQYLCEEATSISGRDPILMPDFGRALAILPSDLSGVLSENFREPLRKFSSTVTIVQSQLKAYRRQLVTKLREVLESDDHKRKKLLYDLTLTLATFSVIRGLSFTHLSGLQRLLCDAEQGEFIERFDKLVSACAQKEREYICRISVMLPKELTTDELASDLKVVRDRPDRFVSDAEKEFYSHSTASNERYIETKIRAVDEIVARRHAEQRVEQMLAIVRFLAPNSQPVIRGKHVLVREISTDDASTSTVSQVYAIPLRRMRSYGLVGSGSINDDVNRLSTLSLPLEEIEQLFSAFEHHRLAMAGISDDSRLLNLWVALETLCRRNRSSGALIDILCRLISSSVACGNGRKFFTNLSIYLKDFQGKYDVKLYPEIFPNSSFKFVAPDDLIGVLTDPDDSRLKLLGSKLSTHPLLLHRIYRAWELLRDGKEVAKWYNDHRLNVQWQLRRIYRARNEITHRGRGPDYTSRIIRHLHAYLGVTIHNLIFDLSNNREYTVPDALSYREILFEQMISRMTDGSGFPASAFLRPVDALGRHRERLLWKK